MTENLSGDPFDGASGDPLANVLADLSAQLDAALAAELADEVAERSRWEVGQLRLVDRLRAALGRPLVVGTTAGELTGVLAQVGSDWVEVVEGSARRLLIRASVITDVRGLGRSSVAPGSEGAVTARLGFRHALRALARARVPVVIVLAGGRSVAGTIDRVGADLVDLAEHPVDEPRRSGTVRGIRTIPTDAIRYLRTGDRVP